VEALAAHAAVLIASFQCAPRPVPVRSPRQLSISTGLLAGGRPSYRGAMKLAEALLWRADLMKKLASLRERLVANAVVQEGDAPHEDPKELLAQAEGVMKELEQLVARIHETNGSATLPDGRTLTRALTRRSRLASQHALLTAALAGTKKEPDRYGVREIKWVATLKVPKLQKQADDVAKKLRELNAQIQEANWNVTLVD
jgi:hypothetical protein